MTRLRRNHAERRGRRLPRSPGRTGRRTWGGGARRQQDRRRDGLTSAFFSLHHWNLKDCDRLPTSPRFLQSSMAAPAGFVHGAQGGGDKNLGPIENNPKFSCVVVCITRNGEVCLRPGAFPDRSTAERPILNRPFCGFARSRAARPKQPPDQDPCRALAWNY